MNTRQRWLAAALVAALAAAFWPAGEEPVEVVERRSELRERPAAVPQAVTAEGAARPAGPASAERLPRMQANLFPRQTWVPPPKPTIPPPPPPPPVPPPLPFKYLGRWVEGGQLTVFLVQGEQPVPVKPGQVLPGNWRVDEITERRVVFTYLPLDMQSTLGITP
ncbi:hypothetical protein [Thiobacillus sp.]